MSKNDHGNTNKIKKKPVARARKLADEVKAEGAEAIDKPEISDPNLKAKSQNSSVIEHPAPIIKEVNTLSSLPETEMEVHHHPQLEHKPKPIKEYLLEGFMIFIAVMMGFIAENIREDITNSEHVRQLTLQLVHELKADTVQLNEIYKEETLIVKYNDTLFNLLQQPVEKADTRRIQKLAANSHSMWLFHPSAGATSAIKNELHLKQFSNSEIINYFTTYERHLELLRTDQDINLQYQRIYLDPFVTQHFTPANLVAAFSDFPVPTAQMRDLTQRDLNQLATDMVLVRIISKALVTDNKRLKNDAVDLLRYVTKQYQLEDK